MAELEKVIQAFENCTDPAMNDDDDETFADCIRAGVCPWDECQERGCKMIDIPLSLAIAALEVLKAQKPMKPKVKHFEFHYASYDEYENRAYCPKCEIQLIKQENYCPRCGQAVKWDD